jgi:hypothetical protein
MEHVVKLMDGNVARAYSRLRDLVLTGKLEKVGRGTDAVWRLDESTDDNSVVRFAAQTK